MQSKTSFFNKTLYRQSMKLSLPVLIGMVATWMILWVLPLFTSLYGNSINWANENAGLKRALWYSMDDALEMIPFTGLIFGVILAVVLFYYLNTSRSISLFHALPLRREGLFLTQYAVGATYVILTSVFTALCILALQASVGMVCLDLVLNWLWMNVLVTLFFFSFAVFCQMFAGVSWAGVVYFGIFNALVFVLFSVSGGFQDAFSYGLRTTNVPAFVDWFTPVMKLGTHIDMNFLNQEQVTIAYELSGQSTVLIYAVVSVVLSWAALAVYRRRPSESASDVVAISWAKPLFRFGMGLCSGLIFGFGLYYILWDNFRAIDLNVKMALALVCMVVVGLIGLVIAEMLMEKNMRIGWKWLKHGAILTVVFIAIIATIRFDLFGQESYVPELEDVNNVTVSISGNDGANTTFHEPENIQLVLNLHQAIVDERERQMALEYDNSTDGTVRVTLWYYDEADHPLAYRYYDVNYFDGELDNPTPLLSAVMDVLKVPQMQQSIVVGGDLGTVLTDTIELDLYECNGTDVQRADPATAYLTPEEGQLVYAAMERDMAEGNFTMSVLDTNSKDDEYLNDLSLEVLCEGIRYDNGKQAEVVETWSNHYSIQLRPEMVHTIQAVESLEIVEKYPLVQFSDMG